MSSSVMRKKELLTICSPIPSFIPRQLAIDVLHDHSEIIKLNPLVIQHVEIPAPANAAMDEHRATWYEITERIQYVPGLGKMGSGKINFNGCFLDMPGGLQTHIYAPMSIDLRANYRIAGNQPGIEPPKPLELGLQATGAPNEGLYLRADIVFESNITLASFVRSQTKTTIKEMVNRIVKKAEQVDAAVLRSMFQGLRPQSVVQPPTYAPYTPGQYRQEPLKTKQAFTAELPGQYHPAPVSYISELPAQSNFSHANNPVAAVELPTERAPMAVELPGSQYYAYHRE